MSVEYYEIYKDKLLAAANNMHEILEELSGHQCIEIEVIWPDKFYVRVDLESVDDQNGLQYFGDFKSTAFLTMGFSDIGFYTTAALIRSVGSRFAWD